MEDKLIEYTDKIVEALEAGIDFAGSQAPLLIQEMLRYYAIESFLSIIIHVIIASLFGYFIYYIMINSNTEKSIFNRSNYENSHRVIPITISSFFIFLNVLFTIKYTFVLIKIMTAPRLFLIQKLSAIFS